LDLCRSTNT